ncbi:MAG: nucleotidyltransferase [Deltaproteobacteria bacterium]|nr:nucleotidyltransferase [Deltaproteobacteria bacterium]
MHSTQDLQEHLQKHGIPSMVIGGIAVAVWGEPRLTRDADLKILLSREEAQRLIKILTPDFRFLADAPETTLQQFGFIFIKDATGVRLDLLLAETSFDAQAIERRRAVEVEPKASILVTSPEDLIVYKMISTRPRDHEDIIGVIRRQNNALDDAYILNWLLQFEQALDDLTLVAVYRRMRSL